MSEMDFFRTAAVKQQAARLDGEVIIAQPISSSVLTLVFLLLVVVIISFLSQSSFHRKETVIGYLKPDTGLAKIVSPRPGVISQLYVEDGQQVKAGQHLALLQMQDNLAEGQSLTESLALALQQQIELVHLRKKQSLDQYQQQQAELKNRLTLSQNLLKDIVVQQQLVQQRLKLHQARYRNYQSLSLQGAVSANDLQQQHELHLTIQQQLSELNASEQSQLTQIAQVKGLSERLPAEHQQQMALLDSDISRLSQQQIELNARGQLLLTAPVSGRVTNLMAEIGTSVQGSFTLLTIMPLDAKLEAVLLVPTRAYGFIQPGQRTRLRFDAFPYQRFGLYEGEVTKTAQTIVLPQELDMPVVVQEPVYRVSVTLDQQHIQAFGNSVQLQSGMSLSADIVLEQRSLLAWLLEPIFSLKGKL
ncbi:multidrug resistance efflux pump [Rheinheimera sp. A13L]|uniref:HlyD family secretion protein n=1 Tax=Rheinheimera sp. A13L TaxID=506534 RepID=UPI000212509B|nr:HlyD family efflux transporter periplasmic adaptor subunit [Rheinheimera sp. A13L]EGM79252.1 multidrug resistance efflux pump [Rheinheimera sp. A13L]